MTAPDTTAGDALREAIAGGLRAVAHWCQHDPCTPCLIISDEEFDAQIEVTAMHGSTPTRIEGKPEAIADALLAGPLAQLLADAAELRAKVQRGMELANYWDATADSLGDVAKDYGLFRSEASDAARRHAEKRVQQYREAARDLRLTLNGEKP